MHCLLRAARPRIPPNGQAQHVSIYTHGAHVSYDRCGSSILGVHATLHDRSNLPGPSEPAIISLG
jgi:hypothetical protein